ncbi:MAG: hypothetical protein ACXVLQ_12300, partial [Bacteriovorax sp.]
MKKTMHFFLFFLITFMSIPSVLCANENWTNYVTALLPSPIQKIKLKKSHLKDVEKLIGKAALVEKNKHYYEHNGFKYALVITYELDIVSQLSFTFSPEQPSLGEMTFPSKSLAPYPLSEKYLRYSDKSGELVINPVDKTLFSVKFTPVVRKNKSTNNLPRIRTIASDRSGLKKFLNWASADDDVIRMAPCKSQQEKSLDFLMMTNFIKAKSDAVKERKDVNINGVDLSDESPVIIGAFKDLTTSVNMMGNEDPIKQKNIQAEFKINPECKKVMCAVEKIWGYDMGPKMLYLLTRYSFNGSEFAYPDTDRFMSDELDDVILGLDDMPLFYRPLGTDNQRLDHLSRGYSIFGDPDIEANALIVVSDSWSRRTRLGRTYTLFHELSHNLSSHLGNLDTAPEWMNLSGWVQKEDEWSNDRNACFTSEYGSTNAWEDFAESVAAYRYNGKTFQEKCPEKYQFIKENVFKNLEYLDSYKCSPIESTSQLQAFANAISADLKKNMNLEAEVKKENCQEDAQSC